MADCRPTFARGALLHSFPFSWVSLVQVGKTIKCRERDGVATAEKFIFGRWLTHAAGPPIPAKHVYAQDGFLYVELFSPAPVISLEFLGSPPAVFNRRWVPLPAGRWSVTQA